MLLHMKLMTSWTNVKLTPIRQKKNKYGCYHPNVITFRHKIGKRMKMIMEKLDVIAAERNKFHFDESTVERQVATRQTGAHLRYFSKKTALYHQIHVCFWDFF